MITLARGGYLIETSIGNIQVGAPPETIKDTMVMEKGVPEYFVLPFELFNWDKGINQADIEFPIYYNFFIKKKKTHIICTRDQAKRLVIALQEAVFGPKKVDLQQDVLPDIAAPEIDKELAFFKHGMKYTDFLGFIYFDDNKCRIADVEISFGDNHHYIIKDKGETLASVPSSIKYQAKYDIGLKLPEPYKPPLFGVTCLGPSHGFDPNENTSGFIIWLNHSGIMVDPPVNSTEWLEDSNVNPKLIDSIILTHCHADHDAGTFQKILEEGRITIYSTKTVIDSFLRKYSALCDEPVSYLKKLFNFQKVYIREPLYIHGGEFRFQYSLHSIPSIGFTLKFQDQSFVYSSDHQADPNVQKDMLDKGALTRDRYDELQNFPWDSNVIYHESGIAPLHTPIKYLNSLPKDTQKRLVIYHIAKKDFPKETDLRLAAFGIENTLYFETKSPHYESAYRVLDTLKHLDFFNSLSVEKVQEFFTIINMEKFKKDEYVIRKGTRGEKFYIIISGNVRVKAEKLLSDKILGIYEYFGEVALITRSMRTADIIAGTDVEFFTIERNKFLSFIAGTAFETTLMRLIKNRSSETWNIFVSSPYFQRLSNYQKAWLESILSPVEYKGPGILIEEEKMVPAIYIVRKGKVDVSRGGKTITELGHGDLIGSMNKIYQDLPADYSFKYQDPVSLYRIEREEVYEFIKQNPGASMRLSYDFYDQ